MMMDPVVQICNDQLPPAGLGDAKNKFVVFTHGRPLHFRYLTTLSLKYVLSGSVDYWVDHRPISLSAGYLLLVKKERNIRTRISGNASGVSVFFSDEINDWIDSDLVEFSIPLIDSSLKRSLNRLITDRDETYHTRKIWGELIEGIIQMSEMIRKYRKSLNYKRDSTKVDVLNRLLLARYIIENNFDKELSIDTLARTASISKFLFVRRFTQIFGVSPGQFIIEKRVEHAKDLLFAGNSSITHISQMCGFGSLHHFSKTFKKRTNYSPSDFRNLQSAN